MKTKLIAIAVAVLLSVGVVATIFSVSSTVSVKNEYKQYITKAQENAAKDIPYVAATNYRKAFDIEAPTEEVFLLYLEEMKKLGEDYHLMALEDYLVRFPMSANAYELNLQRLYEEGSYKAVVELATQARLSGVVTETIKNYYMDSYYQYRYIKVGFDEAQTFLGNYALVKMGELYGYINGDGDFMIAPYYKDAAPFIGSSSAVDDGTGYQMINALGFKIAVPSEPVEYLSFLMNNNILARKNGKYGFLKSDLVVPETFPYDDATNFKNNVAAVCQNGKWALISSDGKNITEFIFDDIIRDEYNTCINNNVIFAKTDGKYYMFDATGKKIGDNSFEDAYPFVGTMSAAVKIDGKWGFVDATGAIVIEPKYEDAKSFNCSLAPVCNNGQWVYIDTTEVVRITGDFEDAKPFASIGVAAVKEGEVWNYIKLITF